VTAALALAACGGGGGGSADRMLGPRDRVEGIFARSDTIVAPSLHIAYDYSYRDRTESDHVVLSCFDEAPCDLQGGFVADTVLDVLDPADDVGKSAAEIGARGGFETAIAPRSIFHILNEVAEEVDRAIPGDLAQIDAPTSAHSYGFWGEHGFAALELGQASVALRVLGILVPAQVGVRYATAFTAGDATGTNPTGLGRATWTGIAEAAATDTFARHEGTASVIIPELSAPAVDVVINLSGASSPLAWFGLPLTAGRYASSAGRNGHLTGHFYGPDHRETYGAFDTRDAAGTDGYVGVFGAKRLTTTTPPARP